MRQGFDLQPAFWVEALDGHRLDIRENTSHLEVLSVGEHANRRWIQLDVCGPRRRHVIVNAALECSPAAILVAVQQFLSDNRDDRDTSSVLVID